MGKFTEWVNQKEKPPIKKDGSVEVDQKIAKKVDLIVLPHGVEGTNCGNCMAYKGSKGEGFCTHPSIKQWVTPRMCCAQWDRRDVKRSWGKMSI